MKFCFKNTQRQTDGKIITLDPCSHCKIRNLYPKSMLCLDPRSDPTKHVQSAYIRDIPCVVGHVTR